jgi:hypothetical protein
MRTQVNGIHHTRRHACRHALVVMDNHPPIEGREKIQVPDLTKVNHQGSDSITSDRLESTQFFREVLNWRPRRDLDPRLRGERCTG